MCIRDRGGGALFFQALLRKGAYLLFTGGNGLAALLRLRAHSLNGGAVLFVLLLQRAQGGLYLCLLYTSRCV